MGAEKQAGQRGFFCEPAAERFQLNSGGGACPGIQSRQVCLYPSIINAQDFGRASHGVNVKVFALGPLFVHELEDRVSWIGVLEDDAGDLEQGSAKMGRATFGDTAGLGVKCTGLKWRRIHPRKGHQSTLVCEPSHIANLCCELRSGDITRALHRHDHIKFRQQRGKPKHLSTQNMQRVIDGVQAVHGLGDEQLCAVAFWKRGYGILSSVVEFFGIG